MRTVSRSANKVCNPQSALTRLFTNLSRDIQAMPSRLEKIRSLERRKADRRSSRESGRGNARDNSRDLCVFAKYETNVGESPASWIKEHLIL